jgi:hypothetical protein
MSTIESRWHADQPALARTATSARSLTYGSRQDGRESGVVPASVGGR